jgi:antagonist of KipI
MSEITVVRAGLFTTVQDLGRWGHQSIGVPVSGPMDERSHRRANAMAGNRADAALLEATLVGPVLDLPSDCVVAAAGALCALLVDGRSHETPAVVQIAAPARLEVSPLRRGGRLYLAFRGGIATELVLGSRATDARSGLGGLGGRALAAGDTLPLGAADGPLSETAPPAAEELPTRGELVKLRVVAGPHAVGAFDALCRALFTVGARSDRVGYRLETAGQTVTASGDLLSMPTTMGSVQVTPSGEVILLMADRQPTGGYAQVAVVISGDLPLAGQLTPGCAVRFVPCSLDEARQARGRAPWLGGKS